ncbi:hypothetical protein ES703_70402 [subsurface metagenome]
MARANRGQIVNIETVRGPVIKVKGAKASAVAIKKEALKQILEVR